jgi:putative Ca2+/H+ antiporter (TMEM165/GDT1 family)
MTVLSAAMGQILPQIISKNYTEILAAILFLVFGLKIGFDSFKLTGNECLEELEEVTAELVEEDQRKLEENEVGEPIKPMSYRSPYFRMCGISPVWIQVFVMTFLAEWGDRSQIASSFFHLTFSCCIGWVSRLSLGHYRRAFGSCYLLWSCCDRRENGNGRLTDNSSQPRSL